MDQAILDKLNNEAIVSEAEERVKADLAALDEKDLIQVNLELKLAVSTTLGLLGEVRALRPQIVKELPTFDIASFDKLEDYALALQSANTDYLTATKGPDDLKVLVAEGMRLRARLETDAKALGNYGLVDVGQLANMSGSTGHRELAQDLEILSRVLKNNWSNIQGKTALSLADFQIASRISTRLMRIVGLKEQGPAIVAAAADHRTRAFTKFLNTYEDARRAVGYLRARQGDADDIIPSLYPGRPRRRATDATDTSSGTDTAPVVAAPTASGTAPATTTSGTSSNGTSFTTASSNTPLTSAEISKKGPFVS